MKLWPMSDGYLQDESEEDEAGEETSQMNKSDAFECFSRGLVWLEPQINCYSTELMLLNKLHDRAAKQRHSRLRQIKQNFRSFPDVKVSNLKGKIP